ncbi:hypothetical protein BDR26DRAFT_850255 [Obelidium mucronatum]|nr:hypothetical protein BDR26DRAFT_850255 [Obelidium mucronatum]
MDDLDDGAFFGTIQPASAKDVSAKDRNSVLPVFLQEARDEKGRKRLHGAFTGGFSAGYYNTVGSKEGWQPSNYQSTRTARGKFEQKAEDFMDEEDFAEINNARKVTATQDFDILDGTKKELERKAAVTKAVEKSDGAIAGRIVQDLIIPANDSIGVRLLRKMGWRDGQGVGPRMKRKFTSTADEEDIHAKGYLFAPQDITAVILTGRVGSFGIGYDRFKGAEVFRTTADLNDGGDGDGDIDGGTYGRILGIGKKRKQGANEFGVQGGFGTGVFEDDDDAEVYSSSKKPAVNFSIVDEEDDDGWASSIPKKIPSKQKSNTQSRSGIPVGGSLESNSGIYGSGFDGKPALPGFHVASFQVTVNVWFDAPKPPPDFIPKFRLAAERAAAVSTPYPLSTNQTGQNNNLTADQRRIMLGEDELKGPTRSVFSFLSRKQQDQLQSLIDSKIVGKDSSKKKEDTPLPVDIPVEKDTALAALKGFLPFATDEAKQERYKRFLEVKAGLSEIEIKHPPHFTPREVAHELLEFSKSAHMYKPLSNMMASRFTSSSTGTDKPEDSKPQERVYGSATRRKIEFKPHKLLCKRFNISNPYPEPKSNGVAPGPKALTEGDLQKEILNSEKMNELKSFIGGHNADGGARMTETLGTDELVSSGGVGTGDAGSIAGDVEKEEPKRPTMDIFKAIFAESEDDSSDESSNSSDETAVIPEKKIEQQKQSEVNVSVVESNVKTSTFSTSVSISAPMKSASAPSVSFRPVFSRKQDRVNAIPTVSKDDSPGEVPPISPTAITIATPPVPEASVEKEDNLAKTTPTVSTAPSRPLVAASWATSLLSASKKPDLKTKKDTASTTDKRKRERSDESGSSSSSSSDDESDSEKKKRTSSSSRKHKSDKEKKKKKDKLKEKKRKRDSSKKKKSSSTSKHHGDEWVEAPSIAKDKRDTASSSVRDRPRASDFF